jgi:hypothetical protein
MHLRHPSGLLRWCAKPAKRGDLVGDVPADRQSGLQRERLPVGGDSVLAAPILGEQRSPGDVQLRPAVEVGAGGEGLEDPQAGRGALGVGDSNGLGSPRLPATGRTGAARGRERRSAASRLRRMSTRPHGRPRSPPATDTDRPGRGLAPPRRETFPRRGGPGPTCCGLDPGVAPSRRSRRRVRRCGRRRAR